MPKQYDVIIVGGASAGLSAALYTSRQNLRTLVVTKDIGGQALLTDSVQNYPGFKNIGGFELLTKFQEQATLYGTEFLYDEVLNISKNDDGFLVKSYSQEITSEVLILAFGKTPRDLGVPGENEFKGKGVSYCAVCDGPLFKSKKVAVVGNGDNAIEAASYLSSLVSNLYIIQSGDKPRGDEETLNALKSMKFSAIKGSLLLELCEKFKPPYILEPGIVLDRISEECLAPYIFCDHKGFEVLSGGVKGSRQPG